MSQAKDKVTITLEMDNAIQALKSLNFNIAQIIALIRLAEVTAAANRIHSSFEDRMNLYEDALERVFGDEFIMIKGKS